MEETKTEKQTTNTTEIKDKKQQNKQKLQRIMTSLKVAEGFCQANVEENDGL